MSEAVVRVVGAGLAGCEAAYAAAQRGCSVILTEMKPCQFTPAHHSENFAELVCSNSFRSAQLFNAIGLLKEELRRCDSLIMRAADACAVPAGAALAVDRDRFSAYVTDAIRRHPNIEVRAEEVTGLPFEDPTQITVTASGPLTSPALSASLEERFGCTSLHFFDAAAPIVDGASVDRAQSFVASRYDKGEAAYVNCPMNEAEYTAFYEALCAAETAPLKAFDSEQQELHVFEGCMPVEVMAKRGRDTLRYGPMKPVGLRDPRDGREPYAAVQLRLENTAGEAYNLVGFQTHLTFPEQRRVFRMIPALHDAEFLRYGVMHRNTYLNSPKLLDSVYALHTAPHLFFAGQMTGVEGYIESAASGFVAGVNAANRARGRAPLVFSDLCVMGAMAAYVSNPSVVDFQPMNANFGLIRPLEARVKGGKRAKYDAYVARSLAYMDELRKDERFQ